MVDKVLKGKPLLKTRMFVASQSFFFEPVAMRVTGFFRLSCSQGRQNYLILKTSGFSDGRTCGRLSVMCSRFRPPDEAASGREQAECSPSTNEHGHSASARTDPCARRAPAPLVLGEHCVREETPATLPNYKITELSLRRKQGVPTPGVLPEWLRSYP